MAESLTINGRPVSEDEYARYWTNVFRTDPEMQRIFAEANSSNFAGNQQARRAADTAAGRNIDGPMDKGLHVSHYSANERGKEKQAMARAKQLGFNAPHDWSLDFDNGGYRAERANYWTRNSDWIAPVGIGALGAGAGLLAGGAAAATPTLSGVGATGSLPASVTGAAGATLTAPGAVAGAAVPTAGASVGTGVGFGTGGAAVPTAGSTVGPGVGFGAGGVPVSSTLGTTTMATAAPAVAGAVAPIATNFFKKALVGLGADAAKTFFSSRASTQANKELQKGGDAAIATYKEAFDPYMKLGANAANAQNYLMGFGPLGAFGGGQVPVSAGAPTQPMTTGRTAPEGAPSLGTAVPRQLADPQGMGDLGSFGRVARAAQQSQSSFIKMRAPDGEVGDVHPSQLQAALAAGAQELG